MLKPLYVKTGYVDMRRVGLFILIVCFCLVLAFPGRSASAQERSLVWNQWDVLIDQIDTTRNRFTVTETYEVMFSGTFRFGTATIPQGRLESIDLLDVEVGGRSLVSMCSGDMPGTYCFTELPSEYSLMYFFPTPVTNARQSIRIRYVVEGALRVYEGGDQLWWDAIPEEHFGFPIRSATVTVDMPDEYTGQLSLDRVATYGAAASTDIDGSVITARATNGVGANEMFSIRVQYPHNAGATPPLWQAQFDAQRAFEENIAPVLNVLICGVSLIIALGSPLLVYTLWRTQGRDPSVGVVPEYLTEPPSALPPGLVGTLLDERADVRDILATLIDLARRGYLVIEEEKQESAFGLIQNSEFTFKRTDKPFDDLRKYEERLIKSIFGTDKLERSLSSLAQKFYTSIPKLQTDMYKDSVKEKLFAVPPTQTRNRWAAIGIVLIVVGILGFFLASTLVEVIAALMVIPIAIVIAGVVTLIAAAAMPVKTREGALEAAKWRAFQEYLRNLDKYTGVSEASSRFEAYLPYTIAFGLDRLWMQRFRRLDDLPMPPWYNPVYMGGPYRRYVPGTPLRPLTSSAHGGLPGDLARAGGSGSLDDLSGGMSRGLESLSTGLSTMLNSASRVFTSVPQSSGGSGWSGGGFSGGGGSGGGSRGFG
jgi:uncharacterized membrane protein YgcG